MAQRLKKGVADGPVIKWKLHNQRRNPAFPKIVAESADLVEAFEADPDPEVVIFTC